MLATSAGYALRACDVDLILAVTADLATVSVVDNRYACVCSIPAYQIQLAHTCRLPSRTPSYGDITAIGDPRARALLKALHARSCFGGMRALRRRRRVTRVRACVRTSVQMEIFVC